MNGYHYRSARGVIEISLAVSIALSLAYFVGLYVSPNQASLLTPWCPSSDTVSTDESVHDTSVRSSPDEIETPEEVKATPVL